MEKIEHLFACAMVNTCTLSDARAELNYSMETLGDAVNFRLSTAIDPANNRYIDDYHESIVESFKRLERMN